MKDKITYTQTEDTIFQTKRTEVFLSGKMILRFDDPFYESSDGDGAIATLEELNSLGIINLTTNPQPNES